MSRADTEPQLVADDWEPSTYEEEGAAELAARIEAAAPLTVRREALEGRCGLGARELWTLGVRTAPAGALSLGRGLVLRVVIVAAVAAMGAALGIVTAAFGQYGDPGSSLGPPGIAALQVMFLLIAHALVRVALWAADRERERRLARRRVERPPVPPLQDPNGRLTVAVLDGPGVLRVLLLWLRGHPRDADLLEARVVAERRVPRDEPGRAEDAVAALSGIAGLVTRGAVATTPAVERRDVAGAGAARVARPATATASKVRVGPGWEPDGTTEEGEAELARRLLRAKPRRWSAELLAPLVVTDARQARGRPRRLPARTEREAHRPRRALVTAPGMVLIAFLLYFVVSDPSAELGVEITMRGLFLAAAGWVTWKVFRPQLLELPFRRRRRPLMRRVDDAACDATADLEAGLPGAHGAVLVLHGADEDRRVVRLAHARRVVDAPEGTLEVRVLAERVLDDGDDPVETAGRFLRVADDQAFTTRRGRENVERLRRLSRRLGLARADRADDTRRPPEVLAILAAACGVLAFLALVLTAVTVAAGDADGVGYLGVVAVLVAMAAALLACTRRWSAVGG